MEQATGFVAGAVAPFPLPHVDRVFVDRNLLSHKRVWVGAGSPSHMAVLSSADLVRLCARHNRWTPSRPPRNL